MAVIFQTYKRISGKKVYINDDVPSSRDKSKSQLRFKSKVSTGKCNTM